MKLDAVRIFAMGLAFASWTPARGQTTTRVSLASSEGQGNGQSQVPSISADGRFVLFSSYATNLVPGDTNGWSDVFVRDRSRGVTARVSVDSSGLQGNGWSDAPSISADGRYVAFSSVADNLVPGDTNVAYDVFVRDLREGITTRVSVDSSGLQGDSWSNYPVISADGRFIAFGSGASNLVPDDTNGSADVFVYERSTGAVTRVSVDSSGLQANSWSHAPSISADGGVVAFHSSASNLAPGDTNGVLDVFVHDRRSGATECVSVDSSGMFGNDTSDDPSITADGRVVAFQSSASNLVPGDTNGTKDAFAHDRRSGVTTRVSVSSGGAQGNSSSNAQPYPSISADGRFVAFQSDASNLVPGDTNGEYDVFVHDRRTGATTWISQNSGGVQGDDFSGIEGGGGARISADGSAVVFHSFATNLVTGDANDTTDVFVRERENTWAFTRSCFPGEYGVVDCPCGNPPTDSGRGCDNFGPGPAHSARLFGAGNSSLSMDTFVLSVDGENNESFSVFWQGRDSLGTTGVVHGAGVRCVTGPLERLYVGAATGGAISRPRIGDLSLSASSSAAGDPITAGQVRHYFVTYRDANAASVCGSASSTVNLTNAGSITWAP